MNPPIEVHIEELVLQGFAPADRQRIAAALERELTRGLTGRGPPGWLTTAGHLAHLDAGTVIMEANPGAVAIGTQVGAALHSTLHQPSSPRTSVRASH
jgi:hypothetical protein